ncbi:tumor protein p63-regulated gene 1 protein [Psammomys obesus]|uniref:tumor protein p63-regulated gene 1 protein n=1 Tax=Psammomys obesus TaxID=48139 RepID=UPI0024534ACB|nr:tumor protein p63-regulated gene 1 protein [Psammomys obesus]
MSTIGSFEGFQPVSLKQEGDDQPSENDHLSTEEEGDSGKDPGRRQISRQQSVTKSTLYPNPYHQPYVSRKYFATRPGAIETAVEDLRSHIAQTSGENVQGFWLLTQIDHWNNEKEKVLLLTDKTLLICKYDFIMLSCVQMQQVPLSAICRICLGKFVFPVMSLDKRPGDGLRICWGSTEGQSLLSRWNPWSTEVPYATFTEHPMKDTSEKFLEICKLSGFMSKLVPAVERAHKNSAGSGRGEELMVLTQPILIETYTGLMSFIGNRNKLGYSLARGSIGF